MTWTCRSDYVRNTLKGQARGMCCATIGGMQFVFFVWSAPGDKPPWLSLSWWLWHLSFVVKFLIESSTVAPILTSIVASVSKRKGARFTRVEYDDRKNEMNGDAWGDTYLFLDTRCCTHLTLMSNHNTTQLLVFGLLQCYGQCYMLMISYFRPL